MAEPNEKGDEAIVRLVNKDRIRIEFLIDDLVEQIKGMGVRAIDSCNGCNNCSASSVIKEERPNA